MKRFDTFGAYMFDLLFGPLKRGERQINQLHIFFRVVGRVFDDMKADAFRMREASNIASASPSVLEVHGQDRDMPRLAGEDIEAYRTRLAMKGVISEKSGTKDGILHALTALGYDRSRIEPIALQDADRWAEFIVFLKSTGQSGVKRIDAIDAEVRKVKEAGSKPSYGVETGEGVEIRSGMQTGFSRYPLCGALACGVWPQPVSVGCLVGSGFDVRSTEDGGLVEFPRIATFAASETFYHPCAFAMYEGFVSDIEAGSATDAGTRRYPVCSPMLYPIGEIADD